MAEVFQLLRWFTFQERSAERVINTTRGLFGAEFTSMILF